MRDRDEELTFEDSGKGMLSNSWRLETGAISAIVATGLSLVVIAISSVGSAVEMSVEKQKVQLASDSTALILSETSRGLIAGFSCAKAKEFAKTFDMDLDSCRIVGSVASVTLSKWFGPFRLEASASASSS